MLKIVTLLGERHHFVLSIEGSLKRISQKPAFTLALPSIEAILLKKCAELSPTFDPLNHLHRVHTMGRQ